MILRRATTAVLAVACATLAACSSSDDSAQSDPPTGSSASPSSPGSASGAASGSGSGSPSNDAGLAAIVVQPSDLPSTFKATPAEKDDDSDAGLLTCIGAKSTKADEKATVQSQDFSSDAVSVSSSVTRFASQGSVDADSAIFRSAKAKPCLTTALRTQLASDPSTGKIVSTQVGVTPGNNGGPSNVVATTTAKIVAESDGKQVIVYVDSVYITGPKLEVEVDFTGIGSQTDSTLATSVASAVAKRAAAA